MAIRRYYLQKFFHLSGWTCQQQGKGVVCSKHNTDKGGGRNESAFHSGNSK